MLLHSQYTNDETCYYLKIFALIDYLPYFHEVNFFVQFHQNAKVLMSFYFG